MSNFAVDRGQIVYVEENAPIAADMSRLTPLLTCPATDLRHYPPCQLRVDFGSKVSVRHIRVHEAKPPPDRRLRRAALS